MKYLRMVVMLLFSMAPAFLPAQEAHSLGIGMATTAAPMEVFGVYWNPAQLAMPVGGDPSPTWTLGSGYSIFDTSNANSPIMQFTPENALKSSPRDPIDRYQQQTGIFAVRYLTAGGGLLYEQRLDFHSSQGALSFFHDRDNPGLSTSSYLLDYRQTTQQIATLIVSYSTPVPLGAFPFLSAGASLKYHKGLQYQRDDLTGSFQKDVATSYQYNKFSSTSGLGFSIDAGILARISEVMQFGMMFQNFQSTFNWEAQQQSFSLDQATGLETPTGSSSVTISAPMPYAVRLGLMFAPQEKNTLMEGEVEWVNHQTNWRFGLERLYPEISMVVRLGSFFDQVSKSQLWCFGGGYQKPNFNIDLSFFTRSLPDLTGSIALGGALSVAIRF